MVVKSVPLNEMLLFDFIGLFLLLSGFVIGLGAVTVIDLHGFLGRTSTYWTEATTRTHKVTKPLIWVGTLLVVLGEFLFFRQSLFSGLHLILFGISIVLILNGLFLSFRVSPYLLRREKEGKSSALLPASWQRKIVWSFLLSDVGWWGSLVLVVYRLVQGVSSL